MAQNTSAVTTMTSALEIQAALDNEQDRVAELVGGYAAAGRLRAAVMAAVARNPELLRCTRESFGAAILEAATMGLIPNGHLANIIRYRAYDKKTQEYFYEAQLQPQYQGILYLARKCNEGLSIQTAVVYEGEDFEFQYGTEPFIRHVPNLELRTGGTRRGVRAIYAVTRAPGEMFPEFVVLSIQDIRRHRNYSKSYKEYLRRNKLSDEELCAIEDDPSRTIPKPHACAWVGNFCAMGEKTGVWQVLKKRDISPELHQAMTYDTAEFGGEARPAAQRDITPEKAQVPAQASQPQSEHSKKLDREEQFWTSCKTRGSYEVAAGLGKKTLVEWCAGFTEMLARRRDSSEEGPLECVRFIGENAAMLKLNVEAGELDDFAAVSALVAVVDKEGIGVTSEQVRQLRVACGLEEPAGAGAAAAEKAEGGESGAAQRGEDGETRF